ADTIAYKYYNDVTLDWVIFLINQIFDPFFQWPLSYQEFNEFIVKKYGSIENAMNTTFKYYKIVQEKTVTYDGFSVPERLVEVDYDQFITLVAEERKSISCYRHEVDLNDQKRSIKILDKSY